MFENIMKFFKKFNKKEESAANSKDAAKERLHLVLMQDRANVSADFLELMKQEIIDVIKKYIDVDESAIDVRLTNKENSDGTNGAPALYANIPILNIKNEARKIDAKEEKKEDSKENSDSNVKNEKTEKTVKEEKVEKENETIKETAEIIIDDSSIEEKEEEENSKEQTQEDEEKSSETKEEVKSE